MEMLRSFRGDKHEFCLAVINCFDLIVYVSKLVFVFPLIPKSL